MSELETIAKFLQQDPWWALSLRAHPGGNGRVFVCSLANDRKDYYKVFHGTSSADALMKMSRFIEANPNPQTWAPPYVERLGQDPNEEVLR